MHVRLCFAALIGCIFFSAAHAQSCNTADRSVLLILDASGSMNARLPNGETRFEVARRAVKGVASFVPAKAQVALRLYGAQSPARAKNCQDSALAVRFGAAEANGNAITSAVDSAKAQGFTPIAFSLQQAASDFPGDVQRRVIVLVSDGKETCQGDPVVTARALAAQKITVHTVGFVVDTAARGQLQNIARITGGTYFDAPVGPELPDTLKKALNACAQRVAAAPPAKSKPGRLRTTSAVYPLPVFDSESGKEVGKLDRVTREVTVPAGIYEVQFGSARWKGIEVRSGEITTIDPGELRLENYVGLGRVLVLDTETGEPFGHFDAANSAVTLMPGLYDLKFTRSEWPFIKVDGGKPTVLKAVRVNLDGAIKWKKHARVVTKDGTEVFRFDAVTYRATLPPGEYVVEIDDRQIPFNAPQGETLDVKPPQ
ncbi:MAG: VWA domain-containing protein [Xanthobacteraceae bacterium]|nr:VWA domain-containing protein [Xanthobacteraceae bacterium]